MVTIEFGKNAKTIEVIDDVYDRAQAQEIAEKHKTTALGSFTGILKAFDRSRGSIILTGYRKRYEPFWHIIGESFYEYHRKNEYQFQVRPEVQSVAIAKHQIKVHPESPICVFEGTDHCFENYKREIVQDALLEKGKDYAKYLDSKTKSIKDIADLKKKDVDVLPVQIRASFLLNTLYKDILKPIQADEILDERLVINRLSLFFAPIHVFEFKEENREARATIEVDGVTGNWQKGTHLMADMAKKYWSAETMFDISTEIAGNILPGSGVAMVITKKIFEKRARGKDEAHQKNMRSAFEKRKR
ncbi:MAG: hypothetical protein AABY01_01060 [Nanoarchaeota archaeon]